jgi:copper chaperone CopZ
MRQLILFITACSLSLGLHAQIGKRILNRAKSSAEHKVNSKIDKKVDETVDKGINEVDTLLTGKKKPEKEVEKKQSQTNSDPQPIIKSNNQNTSVNPDTVYKPTESTNSFALRMNSENTFITIFTNCNCEGGKKKMETALRKLSGVSSTSVDITTGSCQIAYAMNKVKYTELISTINNLGFEADGSPAASGKTGCK